MVLQSPASFKGVKTPIWPNCAKNHLSIGFFYQQADSAVPVNLAEATVFLRNKSTYAAVSALPKKGFSEVQCKAE